MAADALPLERLPADLREWVENGGLFRSDPEDDLAYRCGAEIVASMPERKGQHCKIPAGRGTEHKGVGRCSKHEGEYATGLPPWIGEIPKEVWNSISAGPNRGLTHRATELLHAADRPGGLRKLWIKYLDEEDREIFEAAAQEPLELIQFLLDNTVVAMARVERMIRQERMEGRPHSPRVMSAEAFKDRLTQTAARLIEARNNLLETQQRGNTRQAIEDMLRGLTDEEFAAMKSEPHGLTLLLGS